MATSRFSEVKAPQHFKTPRSHMQNCATHFTVSPKSILEPSQGSPSSWKAACMNFESLNPR